MPVDSDTPGITPDISQDHFLDGPGLEAGVTRFWLVRHGVVEEGARQTLYGTLDVPLCAPTLQTHGTALASLAEMLPRDTLWLTSPLQRARETGRAVQKAGHFTHSLQVEPAFIEQSLGSWNGVPHRDFHAYRQQEAHPFWSLCATEKPPGGESMVEVCERVGAALTRLADTHEGQDIVVFSHGGAIRMALAFALAIRPENALRFTIQNLSVTIIERLEGEWRVVCVNVLPDFGPDFAPPFSVAEAPQDRRSRKKGSGTAG
ncbi:histidine phosphatase family protein [Oecophyllibacter saccharovorans]|uniref:Histidine phosphatase family protein n=1 Tax=Oecophyllibacter saccharovorans TaxID=2558360 RepID=A0A506UKY9_9PROT|nr:histidine phosphatase family protein [Oecophyllibacter saccharovorans]TPW33990.1 histidine phosphatase family protein [Oecophyllibacter saccharovorans]